MDSEDSDQTGQLPRLKSESELGAQVISLVLPCSGSIVKIQVTKFCKHEE